MLDTSEPEYADYFVNVRRRILVLLDLKTGVFTETTTPDLDAHGISWASDGSALAFFSRDKGGASVSAVDLRTLERRRLASVTGSARNPIGRVPQTFWSADGRFVAYLIKPAQSWHELFIRRFSVSPMDQAAPITVTGNDTPPLYQAQGMPATIPDVPSELWVATVDSPLPPTRLASFSAETTAIVWFGKRGRDYQLLVIEGNRLVTVPYLRREQQALPTLVCHGQFDARFLAVRTLGDSRWNILTASTPQAGRVAVERITAGLGQPCRRAATRSAAIPTTATLLAADPQSGEVLLLEKRGLESDVFLLDRKGQVRRVGLQSDIAVRAAAAMTGDGHGLAVVATATEPDTLLRIRITDGAIERLGSWPGSAPPDILGRTEIVQWASDQETLQGLLVLPSEPRWARPFATVLYLHGGPESAATADLATLLSIGGHSAAHVLASQGYAVFLPNFRGSQGYPARFAAALGNGRLFSTPAKDSLAGLDALIAKGVADPQRLAIFGQSYGAILATWMTCRDTRFGAAIASIGTYDLLTDDRTRSRGTRAYHAFNPDRAGTRDLLLDHWLHPEKYRLLSPIECAYNTCTPTLLISTAFEHLSGTDNAQYFNALAANQVPVTWVYYPHAWHGGGWSEGDQHDGIGHIIEWLTRWVPPCRPT